MVKRKVIVRRALKIEQNSSHSLYTFSLRGNELLTIADISKISRDEAGKLIGYQRPEVKKHIQDIIDYLNGEEVLFPNSIILSLSSRVTFRSSRGPNVHDGIATGGTIEIPVPAPNEPKPGWIVDGQQRALALSKSKKPGLAIPINAFIADDVEIQRDQFLRINNTKPLPRGLITELLPEVSLPLPANLTARKIPSSLCDLLNRDPVSPFYGLIYRASSTPQERVKAVVADTSVVKMLQESFSSASGCLFPFRNLATGETDFQSVWLLIITFWAAVRNVFPKAWGKPPTMSRLMHGVGIRAMGKLMDKMMSAFNPANNNSQEAIERQLRLIKDQCHWTEGRWDDLGGVEWNELQNVPRHIRILSNYLIRAHLQARTIAP
jgi:DGQHR domain-containing protein